MTPDLETLARRARACRRWRWMRGMRVVREDGQGFNLSCEVTASKVSVAWIPDLSDPATVGCLLALVREAWGHNAPFSWWPRSSTTWWPQDGDNPEYWSIEFKDYYQGATEAEALVAALEAASDQ